MGQNPKQKPAFRVLVVDDHPILVTGVSQLLHSCPEITDVLSASSGTKALELLNGPTTIDICIVDIGLPDMSGFDLINHIRNLSPDTRIIIETMHSEAWFIRRMIQADADAVLMKQASPEHLQRAIYEVLAGRKYHCPYFLKFREPFMPDTAQNLTPREHEVLKCVAKGMRSTEIAAQLYISISTVEFHRKQIMQKLEAKNVSDMLIKAIKAGLIAI